MKTQRERALEQVANWLEEIHKRSKPPMMPPNGGHLKHKYLKNKGRDQYLNVRVSNGEVSLNGNYQIQGKWKAYFTFEEIIELEEKHGVLNEFELVY